MPVAPIVPIVLLKIRSAFLIFSFIVFLFGFAKKMSPNCIFINGNLISSVFLYCGGLPSNFGANIVILFFLASSGISSFRNLAIPSHLGR